LNNENDTRDIELSELKTCPFCGTHGEFGFRFNRLNNMPNMGGKQSPIISVEITHWCTFIPGQISPRAIQRVGRDRQSAIDMWNMRG